MPQLIIHSSFYSPELERVRSIRVLLPRNYHKNAGRRFPERRFPVIYLQDGQNLFDASTAAFGHWKLQEFMARQPLNRQAILVGIDNTGPDRIREYAPYQRGRSPAQGDAYLQFIEHTLKPFIDREYRTWHHREATGIVGSSMGGLIALYAGLRVNSIFGKVGVLSPSLWFNPSVLDLAKQGAEPKSQFYVAGSKTEMRGMGQTLESIYWAFKTGGFSNEQIRVVIRERGRHSETFWAREFKPMYEWLFPKTVL